ncbi:MAG: hypothetical protein AAF607_08835 [Pseudomonadota bacterium]
MPVDYLSLANAKSRGKRPQYFDDPAVERMMSMLLVTVQELAVTRERLDTIERLLEKSDTLSKSDIESFTPTKDEAYERGLAHRELISRVTRAVEQEIQGMRMDDKTPDQLAEEFSQE